MSAVLALSDHFAERLGVAVRRIVLLLVDFIRFQREVLKAFASRHCEGRIVSVLEGGYALEALGRCALAHVEVLSREQ